ncbi:TlpA family protein disulfide reductase [Pseudoalteromonas denitrificans]|uniref:AhpC/TSA family protein n=1 Tax=Pseudoalteromonas denitrificans DSM 6059 TaxID=1123010 RepID=A0A1I1MHZ5_9GAMM|nr:TlpA disulfide reductase family protein [Pseudoalteromonas denitrificans]SFC82293.1 AhpC/TSA family protein [Pseudoalteromonas denitrificans DSM 6059]
MNKLFMLFLITQLSACVGITHSQTTKRETYISAGQTFPIKSLIDINNKTIQLNKPKQRKLILLFATWCHDSQRTISDILASKLSTDPNLQIVGIGKEESVTSLKKFKLEYQVSFPLISDPDKAIYDQFANTGLPRLLLLDENNKLVKALIGEDQHTIDRIIWE